MSDQFKPAAREVLGLDTFTKIPEVSVGALALFNGKGQVLLNIRGCNTVAEVLAALGGMGTNAANQPGGFAQLDESGNLVGRLILADATGVSLQNGELGVNAAGELVIGTPAGKRLVFDKTKAMIDAYGIRNNDANVIPAGAAKMLTVMETTVSYIWVKTTTGYARAMNWDGTLTANAGSGNPASDITPTWLTAASPYTARIPKLIAVWSTNSSGNPSGDLVSLTCNANQLTALDVSECSALTALACGNNQLTALEVSANTALTSLDCAVNQLTALDVSECSALTALACGNNQLTALDLSANTALTSLDCVVNQLTALDLSANTALTSLVCHTNQITVLDLSLNAGLTDLICDNNLLTTLDLNAAAWQDGEGVICLNNPITSTKALLDAWFATLPEVEAGSNLYVGGAALGLDPAPDVTIAENKGWTVNGDY
jgi:hypothetical protein